MTATLTADGDGTEVGIDTDLHVTGKVAQFGRGVMADVSSKLLAQFVRVARARCSRARRPRRPGVRAGASDAAAPPAATEAGAPASDPAATPATITTIPPAAAAAAGNGSAGPRLRIRVRRVRGHRRPEDRAPEAAPVDLGQVAGGAVAKRLVPAFVVVVVVGVVIWLLRK